MEPVIGAALAIFMMRFTQRLCIHTGQWVSEQLNGVINHWCILIGGWNTPVYVNNNNIAHIWRLYSLWATKRGVTKEYLIDSILNEGGTDMAYIDAVSCQNYGIRFDLLKGQEAVPHSFWSCISEECIMKRFQNLRQWMRRKITFCND